MASKVKITDSDYERMMYLMSDGGECLEGLPVDVLSRCFLK